MQETKWFGSDAWEVDGYMFLHSGRRLPADGKVRVRGEEVGIMLDPLASAAWRESGEVWEAVSPRLIMARFKAIHAGQRIPVGSRE